MAPDVSAYGWLIEAYADLATCRQNGMGVGPIPLTAIQDYADRHQLGDLFVRQILDIDREFVKDHTPAQDSKGANHG